MKQHNPQHLYALEHINRFGNYELRFDHVPPPVVEELRLSLGPAMSDRARV